MANINEYIRIFIKGCIFQFLKIYPVFMGKTLELSYLLLYVVVMIFFEKTYFWFITQSIILFTYEIGFGFASTTRNYFRQALGKAQNKIKMK